jgi:hypothetical protein
MAEMSFDSAKSFCWESKAVLIKEMRFYNISCLFKNILFKKWNWNRSFAKLMKMILGEMVNFQKANLTKSQLASKVNSLKMSTRAFWSLYVCVNFLVSWLLGNWPFLLVSVKLYKLKWYQTLFFQFIKYHGILFTILGYNSNF